MNEPLYCAGEARQMALAAHWARTLGHRPGRIHLSGELGTGKTTFVRGFLRGLGHTGPVRSPTYTLLESYPLAPLPVHHLDLYRLSDPEELEFLGLRELLAEPALIFIEWPERGAGWLPPPDLEIRLEHRPDGRRLLLEGASPLAQAWREAAQGGW